MAKLLLIIACLHVQTGLAQTVDQMAGRWCFTGLRTTIFKVENKKLYVGMLTYSDTVNFNRYMQGLPVDSTVFNEASVSERGDTLVINARFPLIDHELELLYSPADPENILYIGDVYFDSTRIINTNANCSMDRPGCINKLYSQADLNSIQHLKTSESFTRDDAFEFLLRLNERLKSRCNRCYVGFTDAYMNEVLIEMGFNPIVKRMVNKSVWYNTSGFTFYLKEKYAGDKRLLRLIDDVFDWYLK